MLREERCFAATSLAESGVKLEAVREQVRSSQPDRAVAGGITGSRAGIGVQAPRVEFICGKDTLVSGTVFLMMPRIGEHIVLPHEGAPKRYRVIDVCYRYDALGEGTGFIAPAGAPVALPPLMPSAITVQLEED